MNLKRHHVLYILLTLCLIVAVIVLLTPGAPRVSYTASTPTSSAGTNPQAAATLVASTSANSTPTAAAPAILPMRFEIVTTEAAQEQGLGGRADVPPNYAMLFVFSQDESIGFWMKDMLVPIDMIWLADNGTILGIEDSVAPSTYPNAFYPPRPVRYVLETKAGEARRRGWIVGTHVELPLPYRS